MNQYFATFPAGTFDIIAKHLKSFTLDEIKIVDSDNSSVLFQSSLQSERLIEIRYFTNIYQIIPLDSKPPKLPLNGKYFRLMMIRNGEPSQIDEPTRDKLQAHIAKSFGLQPNTHLSKNDFYIIERQSGNKLFTLRLARAKFKREKTANGELRPELAHILCLVANLKAKHTVLDMFCGYSSIPTEAVRGFGCKNIIASDITEHKPRHNYAVVRHHKADARNLDFIEYNSVDRVITDPPWGLFDQSIDDKVSLYTDTISEIVRILKIDGIAVILCGGETSELFEKNNNLRLIGKWNVLVSGKKATICKLQKVRVK